MSDRAPQALRVAPVLLLGVAVLFGGSTVTAQPEGATLVAPDALEWVEIVPGVEFAAAYGDWSSEGHGKFVRFAPGVAIPMHRHSGEFHGVVVSGVVNNSFPGQAEPPALAAGTAWYVPGGEPHANACLSEEPCIFYTHGAGAWDVEMLEEEPAGAADVEAADD